MVWGTQTGQALCRLSRGALPRSLQQCRSHPKSPALGSSHTPVQIQ